VGWISESARERARLCEARCGGRCIVPQNRLIRFPQRRETTGSTQGARTVSELGRQLSASKKSLARPGICCADFFSVMPDYFKLLQQSRRPLLDEEALKERFHRQTAEHHPDVSATGDEAHFADLNAAYSTLREPASRLRHLLELEDPDRLAMSQQIPPSLADLFMRIAGFRRALDIFRKKDAAASSALAKALMADDRLELSQQGEAIRAELESAWDAALANLAVLDSAWQMEPRPTDAMDRLASLNHLCAYLSKWRSQIAEALFQFQS